MLDKVLVVGGSGFIGKRLMRRHPDWHNIDLKDAVDFRIETYLAFDFDTIVFLAAELSSNTSSYHYNLELYKSLLDAVLLSPKQPFVIYSSSAAVYEPAIGEHYEDELPNPDKLYGKSKLLGEQIIQDICDKYTILRFSNVYGDGDGNGVIDIFKRGGKTIYGDGSQVRDYIHVNKIVTAIERIVASPDRYNRQIFNLSSNKGQSVKEIFDLYGSGEPEYRPPRDFDVDHSILDNTLAKEKGLL